MGIYNSYLSTYTYRLHGTVAGSYVRFKWCYGDIYWRVKEAFFLLLNSLLIQITWLYSSNILSGDYSTCICGMSPCCSCISHMTSPISLINVPLIFLLAPGCEVSRIVEKSKLFTKKYDESLKVCNFSCFPLILFINSLNCPVIYLHDIPTSSSSCQDLILVVIFISLLQFLLIFLSVFKKTNFKIFSLNDIRISNQNLPRVICV